jgi:hypothetical protein
MLAAPVVSVPRRKELDLRDRGLPGAPVRFDPPTRRRKEVNELLRVCKARVHDTSGISLPDVRGRSVPRTHTRGCDVPRWWHPLRLPARHAEATCDAARRRRSRFRPNLTGDTEQRQPRSAVRVGATARVADAGALRRVSGRGRDRRATSAAAVEKTTTRPHSRWQRRSLEPSRNRANKSDLRALAIESNLSEGTVRGGRTT